ncbi:MAG TPA: aminoglycoside phosphotransferase family protein [Pyrinomonadaceae bacterium]|nr:aminoglycoside phosphotransferase family protein [Pyrinomonadaceae bacterium]
MSSAFKDSLPGDLITHVTSICGPRGGAWLDGLERIVAELERHWCIEVGRPFPAGEFNFVAPAQRADGELTVLKIAPPYQNVEIFGEAAFLRHRNGIGAVKLIAEEPGRSAILLEHARPGCNLAEMFKDDPPASVVPAIEVLRSIISPPPVDPIGIKTLDEWFGGMRKFRQTKFPARYAERALEAYDRLSRQPNRNFYLHGDFHPGNVVSATRSPFLAIDPKGIIGNIGYDIAVFLNNFHWWQEARPDVQSRLDRAVAQFAEAFGLERTVIRQWAYAQMVLGSWWTFEDMPEHYNNEVAKADIWDV